MTGRWSSDWSQPCMHGTPGFRGCSTERWDLSCQTRIVTIERKERIETSKTTFDERERLCCLASFCFRLSRRLFNVKHVRGGFMVALKVSLHKSPAIYRDRALRVGHSIKAACNKT